jgi:GNAT superfamily N-acetyltransferase
VHSARVLDLDRPAIGRAAPADVPGLALMLARAYLDDPVAVWACASEGLRPRMLAELYATRLGQMMSHEEIWTTAERSSAAVWVPPGRSKTTTLQQLALARCLAHPRLLARAPLLAFGLRGMERRHPVSPPHWYLSLLGTDPQAQGQGLGGAVLQPVLERCDRDSTGAYLESSKERNIAFYARHGFRVTDELRLPRGPQMWLMWREPRGAR